MMNINTEKPQSKHKNINWSKVKQKNTIWTQNTENFFDIYHVKLLTNIILSLPINIEQTKNTEK